MAAQRDLAELRRILELWPVDHVRDLIGAHVWNA